MRIHCHPRKGSHASSISEHWWFRWFHWWFTSSIQPQMHTIFFSTTGKCFYLNTLNIKFLAAWKGVWKQFVKSATGCAQCPGISVRNADYVQERSTQTPEDVSGTTENVVHMTTVLTTLLWKAVSTSVHMLRVVTLFFLRKDTNTGFRWGDF